MGNGTSSLTVEVKLHHNLLELEMKPNFRLKDFIQLQKVHLDRNRFTRIPYAIAQQIETAPRFIASLKELHLNSNRLTSVPTQICLLINLKRLKLDNNNLTTIPDGFHSLYQLEKLTLDNNVIHKLPANLGNLKKLKILRLHNNQLKYIPNDIGELPAIKEISIANNPLPQEVLQLPTLEDVLYWITNCQKIPKAYLQELHRIKKQAHQGLSLKRDESSIFFQLLHDKEAKESFRAFLETELSTINLEFWEAVEKFKKHFASDVAITSEKLVNEASDIYNKYFSSGDTINIPGELNKKVKSLFEDDYKFPEGINQFIFNETQESIFKLMFTDSYKRWKQKGGDGYYKKFRRLLRQ